MKLNNLDTRYLSGLIDAFIANYDEHNTPIPAEKYLSYVISPGLLKHINNVPNPKSIDAAKITFSWIPDSRQVCVDSETNSYETRGESTEDHFTIVLGERIAKLQGLVEEILDKITA